MRRMRSMTVALVVCVSTALSAQEWTSYVNTDQGFSVNFPGDPEVTDIKWDSEYGAVFPGRVFSKTVGPNRHSITVIDYRDAERIHAARRTRQKPTPRAGAVLADRHAGVHCVRRDEVPAAGCQGHLRRVALHRPRGRTSAAAHQSGWVAHVRRNLPAREPPLHPGVDRAQGRAAAGTLSAVPELRRPAGKAGSLQLHLLQPTASGSVTTGNGGGARRLQGAAGCRRDM